MVCACRRYRKHAFWKLVAPLVITSFPSPSRIPTRKSPRLISARPPSQKRNDSGMPKPILNGFLSDKGEARGRPVGVLVDQRAGLLVADDVGNAVWRLTPPTS